MEAGFGRAMTQAREYRKDESKHRAAREFAEAHPVEHIIELLDGDPKLLDKLNKELTDRDTNASHKKLRELEVSAAKKAIEEKAAKEEADLEKRMTRAQHVETFARKLCRKEGIPYEDAVEEALYAAIVSDPNRDISDSDLKNLVARKARVWHKHMGKKKREERTQWVKDKVKDREKAKRRVTARDRSTAPAPGKQKPPKSLEEALMRKAKAIGIPESG
jgi:tRNA(Met) C34 N-acetyltransferase TmcA